jgi:hypothetical protein
LQTSSFRLENVKSRRSLSRANAGSHAELDAMTELDCGIIADLAEAHREFRQRLPHIRCWRLLRHRLRHVSAIAEACL